MDAYDNFKRDYRISAGLRGRGTFEIGETTPQYPVPLHVEFSVEKSDAEAQNTGTISIWNLSDAQLAVLNQRDCNISLQAGYNGRISLISAGIISDVTTEMDSADRRTKIEYVDNLVEVRDTYVSVSYRGTVSWKTIMDSVAAQMGVAITYAYNVSFTNVYNGFSYVGLGRNILTKACNCCGLSWSLQNGIIQVKKPGDVMKRQAYLLSVETGLLNVPAQVSIEKSVSSTESEKTKLRGWEVEYLMNGAINVNDYVKVESREVTGFFTVHKIAVDGDNVSGDWICKAQLLEM